MGTLGLTRQRIGNGLIFAVRLGLGCLLIWSSLPKIRQPYDFLGSVYEYELVGAKLGMLVAMTLPWLELILGISLVAGLFVGGALLATSVLMAVFTFAQASVLWRGLAISCACFSTSGPGLISYATVIRTGLLLITAVVGCALLLFQTPAIPQPVEPPEDHPSGT